MNFGKLHQRQRVTLVTNNGSLPSGVTPYELATNQLGIFVKTKGTCDPFRAIQNPMHQRDAIFKIALGKSSEYRELLDRAQIPNWPHDTIEFSAPQIVGWKGIKAKHNTKEDIVAIGFDGVDTSKTLKAKLGEKLKFYVYLEGQPIAMLFNSVRPLVREYFIDPACIADCADPCGEEACQRIQKALIDQIKRDKFNQIPITTFIKATAITRCDPNPPAATDLVEFTTYCLSICDAGDDTALGEVQSQYPGKRITRTSRSGSQSTYSFQQESELDAPAPFSHAGITLIPDCPVCPQGYTLVEAAKAFEVKVPCGATPASLPGQISSQLIASALDGDTYLVLVDKDQNTDTVLESGSASQGVSVSVSGAQPADEETPVTASGVQSKCLSIYYTGITRDTCLLENDTTTDWTVCGCCSKAPKKWQITLRDKECKLPGCDANTFSDRLAELQAAYPELVISIKAEGQCAHLYEATTYSNCVEPGCTMEDFSWEKPVSYELENWVEVPVTGGSMASNCACGVLLEGARFEQPVDDCTFPYFGHDIRFDDSVHIKISNHSHDFNGPYCNPNDFPVTQLQIADFKNGWGRDVIEMERESMSYFMKDYSTNPLIRQIFGMSFVAKPDIYYDEYQLTVDTKSLNAGWFGETGFKILFRFFFPEGQGKQFEAAINGLIASANLELATVSL